MADVLASYVFLPWMERGISAGIDRVDGSGAAQPRATVNVRLEFNANTLSATAALNLHGPGEVTGLDPRAVIRTWPRPFVQDAEPNFFPLVEFDRPELPWQYTPAAATAGNRLRPWICLIVLADGEFEDFTVPQGQGSLAALTVAGSAVLPLLSQSWAWAHVQISGVQSVTLAQTAALLASKPEAFLSRLVCPRRLTPRTSYTAFLVPAFERGRLAGLQQPVPDALDSLTPAWQPGTDPVRLPVYYQWRFGTGDAGDFESLVRRMQPRTLPKEVGSRSMDVSAPGQGLPSASERSMAVEGALKSPATETSDWPDAERTPFVSALAKLLDLPADMLEGPDALRIVAPPLYGCWHAAQDRLNPAGQPVWFEQLNSDPRNRVVAGLGTQVVQREQDQLMASAWQQLDRIRAINDRLRLAQFARELSTRVYQRHIASGDAESTLAITSPVHARVMGKQTTLAAQFLSSPVANGALEGQFRKIARPLGPIGRRQGRPAAPRTTSVLSRLNQRDLRAAPVAAVPNTMLTQPAPKPGGILHAKPLKGFKPVIFLPGVALPPPGPAGTPTDRDEPDAALFRQAAVQALTAFAAAPAASPALIQVDINAAANALLAAIHPDQSIAAALAKRIRLAPGVERAADDPIEPVMAYPEFGQPMYQPLKDLSQDLLLPGLEFVPDNTISLLLTNQKFVESYMVGLNHEMARELLWNEFPTDQRGSYFRQFWDFRGYVPQPGETVDPEGFRDIRPINAWPRTSQLGANSPRRNEAGGHLVLLIRGDLLRRYPNAMIYAARSVPGAGGQRVPGQEERHPVFRGSLDPNVSFFGFELTVAEAKGASTGADQGWFFVLQEQPGEPRFGLDVAEFPAAPPQKWSDLSWANLAADQASLDAIESIDLNASLPDTRSVVPQPGDPIVSWHADAGLGPANSRASDLAFITLQRPVRIAIHASDMLPEGS
jgi:hypothetical protein